MAVRKRIIVDPYTVHSRSVPAHRVEAHWRIVETEGKPKTVTYHQRQHKKKRA